MPILKYRDYILVWTSRKAFPAGGTMPSGAPTTDVKIVGPHRQLDVHLDQPTPVTGPIATDHHTRLDIRLATDDIQKGQSAEFSLSIAAAGGHRSYARPSDDKYRFTRSSV